MESASTGMCRGAGGRMCHLDGERPGAALQLLPVLRAGRQRRGHLLQRCLEDRHLRQSRRRPQHHAQLGAPQRQLGTHWPVCRPDMKGVAGVLMRTEAFQKEWQAAYRNAAPKEALPRGVLTYSVQDSASAILSERQQGAAVAPWQERPLCQACRRGHLRSPSPSHVTDLMERRCHGKTETAHLVCAERTVPCACRTLSTSSSLATHSADTFPVDRRP